MGLRLERFASGAEWLRRAADDWARRLAACPTLRMGVSVGLWPGRLYAAMTAACRAGRVSFARAEVFLLEEYGGLDRDDPGRGAAFMDRFLLRHVDLPPDRFHVPDVDNADAAAAAADYDARLAGGLDWALAPVGGDGRVGWHAPGRRPPADTSRLAVPPSMIAEVTAAVPHDRFPTWGLAVGWETFRRAKELWLLA
ncbi:MAG: hypothetical protein D6766_09995, partial [Verrucomicrobia bacterium]